MNQKCQGRVPSLATPRNEWKYGFDLDVTKTGVVRPGTFSPFLSARLSHRDSSLDAFSYYEHRFSVGVRRAF